MKHVVIAFLALLIAVPAAAQTTYPTPAGSRVSGVAPLQCDSDGANCAPITAANPLQVTGSSVPSGSAGSPSTSVLSVQGVSGGTAVAATETPSAAATSGLVSSATTSASSSQVVKASAGTLYGFSGYSSVNGFFLVFNATSAPADGAITPVKCYPYVATTPLAVSYYPPLYLSTGATVAFSTTGCFSKTASATAFISGDAK